MALRLIVGLGNPGTKYSKTRHNAGFLLLDQLLSTLKTDWQGKKFEAEWARVVVVNQDCLLIKPQTFMNLSGKAVAQAMRFYKLSPENIVVVHDDIDMPLGKVKIRIGGGHGGHNGIRSIMDELSADSFARLKLGVGRPEGKFPAVSDWVLSDFADSELDLLSGPMFKDSLDRLKSLLQPVK